MANAHDLLMAQRAAMMGKSGYTAKDYVQDGLVAMWDGIENAGWGVHDPNATVWKDLVGTTDLILNSGYAEWTDDSVTSVLKSGNYSNGLAYSTSKFTGCMAIEAVATQYAFITQSQFFITLGENDRSLRIKSDLMSFSGVELSGFEITKTFHVSCNYLDPGCRVFVNGSLEQEREKMASVSNNGHVLTIGGRNNNNSFFGDINCVRFYSRFLSDSEIAANYAIDKARFNLP